MSTSATTIALRCSTGKICRRGSVKCSRCSPRLELSSLLLLYFDQEIFTLSGKDDAIISIEIEGQSINFLIDSCSSINAIDK
jgi:hypothetical protein